jgi:ABC-type glycerol-3-phosphate transport system substrate-binding protein
MNTTFRAGTQFASFVVAALASCFLLAGSARAIELVMPTYQLDESFGPWWRAAAEEFAKENPGNSIKLVPMPYEQHHNQLTTRFVAGDPPDLAHISARFYFSYADQGFLEPLDDRLAKIGWQEKDFIGSQAQLKRKGHVYAQLLLGYGWGLFYNSDMFAKAGVGVPKTKDELMAAARKLTIAGQGGGRVQQYGYSVATNQSSATYMKLTFFLTGLGHSWIENGKLVSKENLKQALGMTAELLKEHAAPAGFSEDQERQTFWQGGAAMYIDGSWAVGYKDKAAASVKTAYKVAPLPFADAAGGPSNVLAIPAALPKERKDLAFKFIELVQRPEWQRKYAEMTGNPPARIMPLSKEALAKWPEISVFVESTKNAKLSYLPVGKETEFAKWSNIVAEGVSGLAGGALTLDQAVNQIHDELQSAFF